MEFTGERVIPGQTDPDLMNEHLARYCFAEALVGGKRVLDAGCGVPYGAARLSDRASRVVAVDNSAEPLLESRSEYRKPNLSLLQADCTCLPFSPQSFDVVVAFEVIEHLENWRGFLAEAERILAPSGQLIVSTPNREYYSETRTEPNLYHVHEFDYEEFSEELGKVFPHVILFLENHSNAITFTPLKIQGVRTTLEVNSIQPEESHFFLATCSKQPLFGSPAFVYLPQSGNVLREREKHIALLDDEIKQKEKWLAETTEELKQLDEEYRREQKLAQETITQLEQENTEKTKWAEELEQTYEKELQSRTEWAEKLESELEQARTNYQQLEAEREQTLQELQKCVELLDDAEKRVVERTEWAQRLDRELEQARQQLARIYASPAYRVGRRLRLAPDPASPDTAEQVAERNPSQDSE